MLDEMVNLYKLTNSIARAANYEQLLRLINDTVQGSSGRIGFYFGGTPEFMLDPRRGMFSYEALKSRLEENRLATADLVDMSGPVIRLQNLTPEDVYLLLDKLRILRDEALPSGGAAVPPEAIEAFLRHCSERIGDAYFRTPRNTIKGFLGLLAILDQYPDKRWTDLLPGIAISREHVPSPDEAPTGSDVESGDDDMATFRI